jgi:hypothetical protein
MSRRATAEKRRKGIRRKTIYGENCTRRRNSRGKESTMKKRGIIKILKNNF